MTGLFHKTVAWNERRPANEHLQWFENLRDLHRITQGFVRALADLESDPQAPKYSLPRLETSPVAENLWMLERLTETARPGRLEDLLTEMEPETCLHKLHQVVWLVFAWTLTEIFKQTPAGEKQTLMNLLQQSAWNSGRATSLLRWPDLSSLDAEDLRSVHLASRKATLGRPGLADTFMAISETQKQTEYLWLRCPHQSPYLDVTAVADEACELLSHWMRGFHYGINSRIHGSYQKADYCRLSWKLQEPQSPQA